MKHDYAPKSEKPATAASLVDSLEYQIRSSSPIVDGPRLGRIESQNRHRNGQKADGLGRYRPGRDRPNAVNVPASMSAPTDMANKKKARENPRSVHLIADYGSRYIGGSGQSSLAELSRLSVAFAALSAQKAGSKFDMVVSGNSKEPELITDFQRPFRAVEGVMAYDEYTEKANKRKRRGKLSTLADGLNLFSSEQVDLHPENDVLIVVSDFLTDPKTEQGHLTSFGWEDELSSLQTTYMGRLLIVRLTSLDQEVLAPSPVATDGDHLFSMDYSDYLTAALRHNAAGVEASQRIATVLSAYDRTVELDAIDPMPNNTLRNFLYSPLTATV